jgi:outer membrane protein TolC
MDRGFDGQAGQYSAGIVVSMPWGNDDAIGKKKEAESKKQQSILNLKKEEINTAIDVNKFIDIIQADWKRVDAMKNFVDNAKSNLKYEEERLEKGLTTELEVLRTRRDYTEAETRYLASVVDSQKAYLELEETSGLLLKDHNIVIQ